MLIKETIFTPSKITIYFFEMPEEKNKIEFTKSGRFFFRGKLQMAPFVWWFANLQGRIENRGDEGQATPSRN